MFYILRLKPPKTTHFPYTTLFRSEKARDGPRRNSCTTVRPEMLISTAPSTPRKTHACCRPVCASTLQNRSEEHTSELQSHSELVCRLLLEKKKHAEILNRKATVNH